MRGDPFAFLRGSFFRWARTWPEACPDLREAPRVLAVADLHVDNYGTWRDREGRLVWGVNDFDEAFEQPYAVDLVRLATSAAVAKGIGVMRLRPTDACDAVVEGYTEGITDGGRPFVLAENNSWLRDLALSELRDPVRFWWKIHRLPRSKARVPPALRKAIAGSAPEPGIRFRVADRVAGLGSLGLPRMAFVGRWRGGFVAREAKRLVPPAAAWASGRRGASRYARIVRRALRVPDPALRISRSWLVRRLSPDCSRIDIDALPRRYDEYRLLYAMGYEAANVHLGTPAAQGRIRRDLKRRRGRWLRDAAATMAERVARDWREWRRSGRND
jgi:uncharacterized protein (DUF2252 family)